MSSVHALPEPLATSVSRSTISGCNSAGPAFPALQSVQGQPMHLADSLAHFISVAARDCSATHAVRSKYSRSLQQTNSFQGEFQWLLQIFETSIQTSTTRWMRHVTSSEFAVVGMAECQWQVPGQLTDPRAVKKPGVDWVGKPIG